MLSLPVTCVIQRENGENIILQSHGIKPLLDAYQNMPEALKNAQIADKIIGKAAAAILVLGGAAGIYAEVMSESAKALLEQNGIPAEYGALVHEIRNREDTGSCPMERIAAPHSTPEDIYSALCDFFKTKNM